MQRRVLEDRTRLRMGINQRAIPDYKIFGTDTRMSIGLLSAKSIQQRKAHQVIRSGAGDSHPYKGQLNA